MSFITLLIQGFRKESPPLFDDCTAADEAAYDLYCAEMLEEAVAERNALQAEWSSMTPEEQSDELEWIDELAERGVADTHRFYSQWRERLRRQ